MSPKYSNIFHACILCILILTVTGCSHGSLKDLDEDDHAQYLLADGSRAVNGDLDHGNNRITNVASAIQLRDALNLQVAEERFVSGAAGPYSIVAAGRFNLQGQPLGPTYNDVRARPGSLPSSSGLLFELTFDGYQNPDGPGALHTYIVKGLAADRVFQFVRFTDVHLLVRIMGNSQQAEFMIEVSQI